MQHAPKDAPSMEAIARQANYEGNDSLLLAERLSHPAIRRQVINLLLEDEKRHVEIGHRVPIRDAEGNIGKNNKGKVEFQYVNYGPKSQEELERAFDERLHEVTESTPVASSDSNPVLGAREVMPIGWMYKGKIPSVTYMSAVEAHEKGHYVRQYTSNFFRDYFAPGFDFNQISFTEQEIAEQRGFHPKMNDEEIRDMLKSYMRRGMEIAERMSQLKNYFGMKGNEEFTAGHLAYAREHYLPDTGIDNGMAQFFQAITPETQKEFLRLINKSGI